MMSGNLSRHHYRICVPPSFTPAGSMRLSLLICTPRGWHTLACSRSRWGQEASWVGKLPLAFSSGRAGKNGRTAVAQSNPYPTETVSALKITCQSGLHIFNPCHRSLVHFTFVLGFSRSGFLVFNFWRMVMAKMSITV